jgi:CBS domain-containing protein
MSTSHLATLRVRDAMHHGIVSCDPDAPVRLIAQIMADKRVHGIVVRDRTDDRNLLGIVSALHVAIAVAGGGDATAAEMLDGDAHTISAGDTIERAAQIMAEHDAEHLVVIEDIGAKPVGILSSLDIARCYGH